MDALKVAVYGFCFGVGFLAINAVFAHLHWTHL